MPLPTLLGLLVFSAALVPAQAFAAVNSRPFLTHKLADDKPKLILITGSPGTGKSTFGMSVALDQGILKCISTDTVRAVMRSFVREDISPALHRSSYAPSGEGDDPVNSWKKTCSVLDASIKELVDDAINRGQSLVLEGVHVIPSTKLIHRWEKAGGVAIGCMLTIRDPDKHTKQLRRRGVMTGKTFVEEKKIKSFDRIRAIQDEMIRLAEESDWLFIEQRIEPDPLEMVAGKLWEPKRARFATEVSDAESEDNDADQPALETKKTPKTEDDAGDADHQVSNDADHRVHVSLKPEHRITNVDI